LFEAAKLVVVEGLLLQS